MSSTTGICDPFTYASGRTPVRYACVFGATGVRLYREYLTLASHVNLRCRACACRNRNQTSPDVSPLDGDKPSKEHTIGWLVAAIPTEDGLTYWGFTAVPAAGVKWWDDLPKTRHLVGPAEAPPVGGSIHSWERGTNPFAREAMPEKFQHMFAAERARSGWLAIDWCGNVIGFVSDGDYL